VLDRPRVRVARTAYQRYYGAGTHRTASAAAYYGILTMLPFLGLFYLLLAQLAHADPNFLRSSRRALQASLGLSPSVVANLYSAQGTASLRSVLTLLGVVGLVYAGVNWMDAVEQGLWSVWPRAAAVSWWRRYLRRWATLLVTLPGLLLIVLVGSFAAAASPFFGSRDPRTTTMPCLPSSRAVSKPRPRLPPVMNATFPFNLRYSFCPFHFCSAKLHQRFNTPSCCISEKRFPTPQWSVILPSRTRITSTVSK